MLILLTSATPDFSITSVGSIDDVNVMAFGKISDETCMTLRDSHNCCFIWVEMHGASFASQEYVLLHFPKEQTHHLSHSANSHTQP
jgi:hypothetical protein